MYCDDTPIQRLARQHIEDLLEDLDPDETRYPDAASTHALVDDLALTIDGAIADWILLKKEEIRCQPRS